MPAAGSQGPARWAWEAEAGQLVVLYTKTTPFIVTVSLFPCLAVLIITPHHQTETKRPHWLERNEENVWEVLSFLYLSPLFSLSKHCPLCGIIGNNVFWAHWCELLCCFESVRTVCNVHHQCHLKCEECGSMLKLRDKGRCSMNTADRNFSLRGLKTAQRSIN